MLRDFNFKGLTARRLYNSFGFKRLKTANIHYAYIYVFPIITRINTVKHLAFTVDTLFLRKTATEFLNIVQMKFVFQGYKI
jgi:hypothetical protein